VEKTTPTIVRVIKLRIMRWAGHVVHMGEGRGMYRVLLGKCEGDRTLGRPRHRWLDNIKKDRQEVECGGKDGNELAQDGDKWQALVKVVMNVQVA
jgi:hypothetical protein